MNVYYIVIKKYINDSIIKRPVTRKVYISPNEAIKGLEKSIDGIPNEQLFILCWNMTEPEIINATNNRDRTANYLPGTTREINPATVFAELKKTLYIELLETETKSDERLEQ